MAEQTIRGLRELGELMVGLKEEVNQRIANRAVSKGAQFIRDLAKSRAPVLPHETFLYEHGEKIPIPSGTLRDNIVSVKVSKSKTALTSEFIVTVRGKRKDKYAARYGRLVEYGTVNFAPEPYLRPAFDSGKETAASIIANELSAGLDRAIKKAAK